MNGGDPSSSNDVVAFCCQKCGNALKLDSSLIVSPDQKFLREITAPLYNTDQPAIAEILSRQMAVEAIEYTSNHSKRNVSTSGSSGHTAGGDELDFMLVKPVNRQFAASDGMEHVIRVKSKLYDLLSSQAEIDHPLCEDCTEVVLDDLGDELKVAEEDCTAYKELLDQLKFTKHEDKAEDYKRTLKQLEEEEADLLEKLKDVEEECKKLDSELLIEAGKRKDLADEEEECLKEYSELKKQVFELENEERSVDNQYKYAEMQLDRLVKLNAFNSTFHIWHSGHFGTINGFRLGRLPSIPVDWNEINTAWGQTVLLLHALARKMDLTFKGYKLVPYGSHSYIESLTDKTRELPLYCTGGYRFFWDKKFDQAMVAFLDCLQQFKEQVEKGDSSFCLPYKMVNGKIEDTSSGSSYCVKMQFNTEEQWTKALKFMLTNLRWGLTWVSSQFSHNE